MQLYEVGRLRRAATKDFGVNGEERDRWRSAYMWSERFWRRDTTTDPPLGAGAVRRSGNGLRQRFERRSLDADCGYAWPTPPRTGRVAGVVTPSSPTSFRRRERLRVDRGRSCF